MTGIEILETTYEYASLIPIDWVIMFALVGLIVCLLGGCTIRFEKIQFILIVLVAILIICMLITGLGALIKTDKIIDTKYKIKVSDEVKMNEFYEHYEILEQNEEIFIVREK